MSAAEIASLASADTMTQTAGTTSLGTGGILHGGVEVQGGSLVGSGSVRGDVENSAVVGPGNSPGTITVAGNYTQNSSGTLNIEIAGTTPGTQHDQLVVNGTVTLAGTLNPMLINGFTPTVTSSLKIVDNDGTDAVSGTFAGLPEGARISSGNVLATISYVGGTGNDVVLTLYVNRPPEINAQSFSINENLTQVGTVAASDPDIPVPGDTLTLSIAGTGPDDAKFSITSGGVLSFITAPDYENPNDLGGTAGDNAYVVNVRVTDSLGLSATAAMTVNVLPVNDNSPVFTSAATASVPENSVAVQTLAATDADRPVQTVSFAIVGGVDQAKFTLVGGNQLRFVSAPDFESPADANADNVYVVNVQANDNNGLTTTQAVSVTVTNVNEAPTAVNDTATANEDGPAITIDLTANDTDLESDDVEIQSLNVTGTLGIVTIDANIDSVTYNPNGQFESLAVGQTATDVFRYTINDGHGLTSTATVTVTINGQNDPPAAAADSATTREQTPVTILVLVNDTDLDGDSLLVASVADPDHGSATVRADQLAIIYTPDPGFADTETFSYTVSDGHGGTATANVTVLVNDPPVANDDAYVTDKRTVLTIATPGVLDNDTDVNVADTRTVTAINGVPADVGEEVVLASGAHVTLNADGSFSYDPHGAFNYLQFLQQTDDSFTYTVSDGRGGSDDGTVTVAVTNSIYEQPDLTLNSAGISFSPLNPTPGQNVTISAVIRNAGLSDAAGFSVSFSDFGTLLGTRTVPALAAGATTTVTLTTSFPSAGYRLIRVKADSTNAVSETRENNNEANAVLQVGTPVTPSAVIHVTANNITTTPGQIVTEYGTGFYDFTTVPGTQDFPVQGGAVTVEVLDATATHVLGTYTGAHTTVNGDLGQALVAPLTDGTYVLRVSVTDTSATGFALA